MLFIHTVYIYLFTLFIDTAISEWFYQCWKYKHESQKAKVAKKYAYVIYVLKGRRASKIFFWGICTRYLRIDQIIEFFSQISNMALFFVWQL